MKKKYAVALGVIVLFIISGVILGQKKTDAGQDLSDDKEFVELTKENPYAKSAASRNSVDLYAKGKNVSITKDEVEWQKKVIELTGVENLEEAAYKEACRFKTLVYYSSAEGFSTSDEEISEMIKGLTTAYEEFKKDGIKIAVFEEYGGVENYEKTIWELSRQKMNIQKFMKSKEEEFYNSLDEETLNNDIPNNLWEEKRKEIEEELVEQENFKKI